MKNLLKEWLVPLIGLPSAALVLWKRHNIAEYRQMLNDVGASLAEELKQFFVTNNDNYRWTMDIAFHVQTRIRFDQLRVRKGRLWKCYVHEVIITISLSSSVYNS